MAVNFRSYLDKDTKKIDVLSAQRIPLGSLHKDADTFWTSDRALRISILDYNGDMAGIGDTQIDRRLHGSLVPEYFPRWHTLEAAIRQLSYVLH